MDLTYEEAVEDLIKGTEKVSKWLIGFCCSRVGYEHGQMLLDLLTRVEETSGHSTPNPGGTSQADQ